MVVRWHCVPHGELRALSVGSIFIVRDSRLQLFSVRHDIWLEGPYTVSPRRNERPETHLFSVSWIFRLGAGGYELLHTKRLLQYYATCFRSGLDVDTRSYLHQYLYSATQFFLFDRFGLDDARRHSLLPSTWGTNPSEEMSLSPPTRPIFFCNCFHFEVGHFSMSVLLVRTQLTPADSILCLVNFQTPYPFGDFSQVRLAFKRLRIPYLPAAYIVVSRLSVPPHLSVE